MHAPIIVLCVVSFDIFHSQALPSALAFNNAAASSQLLCTPIPNPPSHRRAPCHPGRAPLVRHHPARHTAVPHPRLQGWAAINAAAPSQLLCTPIPNPFPIATPPCPHRARPPHPSPPSSTRCCPSSKTTVLSCRPPAWPWCWGRWRVAATALPMRLLRPSGLSWRGTRAWRGRTLQAPER